MTKTGSYRQLVVESGSEPRQSGSGMCSNHPGDRGGAEEGSRTLRCVCFRKMNSRHRRSHTAQGDWVRREAGSGTGAQGQVRIDKQQQAEEAATSHWDF